MRELWNLLISNTTTPQHNPYNQPHTFKPISTTPQKLNTTLFHTKNNHNSKLSTRRSAVMDSLAQRFSSRRCPIMMQAQRSAKKTVSAMTVLVSRNDDDDDEEEGSRTGMVSSTAISGIL